MKKKKAHNDAKKDAKHGGEQAEKVKKAIKKGKKM